jgi:erythromycin esterase-like protein
MSTEVDRVLELVDGARFVLLGEGSHGTHDFYELRSEITKRLVEERGFRGVACEADWPSAQRANEYIQGRSDDEDAEEALADFIRWPRWMWRNPVVVDLVESLREHGNGAGFYGLDLYSLRESMHAVVEYLEKVDPEAAKRARIRYACFDGFEDQAYGQALAWGIKESCEDAAVAQLVEMRARTAELASRDGQQSRDAEFYALQNAKVAADAERYYRRMFRGRDGWNLRDEHMADTLDALHEHLGGAGIVVWAHNSHVGDARASEMGTRREELNVGQLTRERHGEDQVRIVGFTTHTGTVTAGHNWDDPPQTFTVRPGIPGSVERRLHESGTDLGVFDLRGGELRDDELLQRFIGVVYRPETERLSHYMATWPARMYDVLVHVDDSTALEPLDREAVAVGAEAEPPETYPYGV